MAFMVLYVWAFLYVDIVVNSLVINLMFSWNEKYYKKLCGVCIMCLFRKCDPYSDESQMADMVRESRWSQRAVRYLRNELAELTTTDSNSRSPRRSVVPPESPEQQSIDHFTYNGGMDIDATKIVYSGSSGSAPSASDNDVSPPVTPRTAESETRATGQSQ